MVEGARASSKTLSTKVKRRVRRPLHHASRCATSVLPRDSGEGGPSEREAIGWWKGAGLVENSFDDNEATSQTPPPPRFAWSPSPAIAGAERQSAPVLAARFLFSRVSFPPCCLTPSPPRHSWVFPCAHP